MIRAVQSNQDQVGNLDQGFRAGQCGVTEPGAVATGWGTQRSAEGLSSERADRDVVCSIRSLPLPVL